jgi:hypothetical protein
MGTKKKSTGGHNDLSAEEAGRKFEISIGELKRLMETRGVKELNERYGGLSGIEQKLKTNLINGKIKLKIF